MFRFERDGEDRIKRPSLFKKIMFVLRRYILCTLGWHNFEEAIDYGPDNNYEGIKILYCFDCGEGKRLG